MFTNSTELDLTVTYSMDSDLREPFVLRPGESTSRPETFVKGHILMVVATRSGDTVFKREYTLRELRVRDFAIDIDDKGGEEPCAGLAEGECRDLFPSGADYARRFEDWFMDFQRQGVNPRTLTQSALLVDHSGPPDLPTAVAEADAIVVGRVSDLEFVLNHLPDDVLFPWMTTRLTLEIEALVKGDLKDEVTIRQIGGPQPDRDWESAILGYAEFDPHLFSRDRALLFLQKELSPPGTYSIQPWSGQYLIGADNRLSATSGNRFAATINGHTVEEFIATIETILAQQAAGP